MKYSVYSYLFHQKLKIIVVQYFKLQIHQNFKEEASIELLKPFQSTNIKYYSSVLVIIGLYKTHHFYRICEFFPFLNI